MCGEQQKNDSGCCSAVSVAVQFGRRRRGMSDPLCSANVGEAVHAQLAQLKKTLEREPGSRFS